MSKILGGLFLLAALGGAAAAHAQNSSKAGQTGAQSADKKAELLAACHLKVNQLTEQLRPLHAKRAGFLTERKRVGQSGGETAKYKLSHLDQEIVRITKQIDGVNGQINSEKKRCDDLASKPASSVRSGAPAKRSGRR